MDEVFEIGDVYESNINHFKTSDDIQCTTNSAIIHLYVANYGAYNAIIVLILALLLMITAK